MKQHQYQIDVTWTGSNRAGTRSYTSYERSHTVAVPGKPLLECSSDPAFRGDRSKYNPEELFVASLSSCHMLWFLHLCSDAGICVTSYTDSATATMEESADRGGRFTEVILHPEATITDPSRIEEANTLHHEANRLCFIASSCNFPVRHHPVCHAAPL